MRNVFLIGLLAIGSSGSAAEFTLRQVETARSSDPAARTIQRQLIEARRKDGASYSGGTSTAANGRTLTTASLQLPDERRRIVMDVSVKRKSTYPVRQEVADRWKKPPADCTETIAAVHPRLLGRFQMFGVEVQRFLIDNAEETLETNLAPQLACLPLRDVHRWKGQNGTDSSETVRDTVELKLGAPEPSLFIVPADLEESKPSEARDARYRYMTDRDPPYQRQDWQEFNRRIDAQYEKAVSGR